ncbi:hypothetical protein GCM10010412_066810 [Nonomuraea recticatena]|uniref:Alpha/beta hydrolase family protein n=1 Tax=Nonomuraea recticatena TaxID=46178 RepID=A0ABN3SP65_9ACTN
MGFVAVQRRRPPLEWEVQAQVVPSAQPVAGWETIAVRVSLITSGGAVLTVREKDVAVAEVEGVAAGYELHGPVDGEPVLLLGGTSMPRGVWTMMQLPALVEAGYQVAAVDPRAPGSPRRRWAGTRSPTWPPTRPG